MFAILQISESKSIFHKLKIHSQRVTLPKGEAFFIVSAENFKGRASVRKLESCLGILKKDIIIGSNTAFGDNCSISLFVPDILPRLLLINSAIDKLRGCHYKSLILYDEKSLYTDYAEKLISFFDRIRVITPAPDKYKSVAADLMENYGFSLEVTSTDTFDGEVVISHNCCVPLYYSGIVFTNEKKYLMNARVFSGSEIELPDLYENLRPANIGRVLFASALYEKCKEYSLGKTLYKDFSC